MRTFNALFGINLSGWINLVTTAHDHHFETEESAVATSDKSSSRMCTDISTTRLHEWKPPLKTFLANQGTIFFLLTKRVKMAFNFYIA